MNGRRYNKAWSNPDRAETKTKPSGGIKAGKERVLDPEKMDSYWKELYSILRKFGPSAGMCELVTKDKVKMVSASINPMNWNTRIVLPSNLSFRGDKRLEVFMQKMQILDPFRELIRDVGKHEFGHWELPRGSGFGCPMDNVLHHESFLQPIFEELQRSGKFSESGCKKWSGRIANAIEDIINNYNVFVHSKAGTHGLGQVLFWYLAGQTGGTYSSEYTLFVKANLMLMQCRGDATKLLEQFFARYEKNDSGGYDEVEKKIGEAVARLGSVLTPEKMLDRGSWEEIARAYTREIIEFIEDVQEPEMPMSGGDCSCPQSGEGEEQEGDGQSGEGQQGEDSDQDESEEEGDGSSEQGEEEDGDGSGQEEGEDEDEDSDDGSGSGQGEEEDEDTGDENDGPFDKLTPKDVEQIMGGRKESGKGMPFYLKHDVALDGLYRSLSRAVRIKTKHGDLPTADYPVVAVRRRAFDAERDEVSACDMTRVVVDPVTRRAVPTVITHWHSVDMPIRKTLTGFPAVAFALVDASGSMMGGWSGGGDKSLIPWGDRSGYHYAILAFYGLLRQLEHLGVMHKVEFSGAIFHSNTTAATGLDKVKEMLLNPTSGGTNIDMDTVREMLSGKEGALFPFISDGGIDNWETVKEEFIEIAKKQQFFMVLVGDETTASRDLEAAGLPVFRVDSYEDVVGLVVDLTADAYTRVIKEKIKKEAMKMHRG
ncbi:MAG: hypothetical protein GY852_03540 [bacterium]|nr:hypothetical protein [bacterium]